MKRLAIPVAILAIGLAGCGSSNSTPTTPSNITVFGPITLLPSNEVPPIADSSESGARGTATITVHKDTNAIDFAVSVNNFPAGSAFNNAHIHNGAAGVQAGVFVPTGLTTATFPPITNGAATFSLTVTTTADNVTQILANPAGFYFNLHTVKNGGGVMRGQLK